MSEETKMDRDTAEFRLSWTQFEAKLRQVCTMLGQVEAKFRQGGAKLDPVGPTWGKLGAMLLVLAMRAITTQGLPHMSRKIMKDKPKELNMGLQDLGRLLTFMPALVANLPHQQSL